MKILYFNSSDITGGAAIAARRLAFGLEKKFNTKSYYFVGKKDSNEKNVFSIKNSFPGKVDDLLTKTENLIGSQYSFLPFSKKVILSRIKEVEPDIISLHNIHGGFFPINIIKDITRLAPTFWTFHDMWGITGHCSYSFECEKWKNGCGHCPDLSIYPKIYTDRTHALWEKKKELYAQSKFSVVTPSQWLADLSKKSPLLGSNQINLINNGIDLNLFSPQENSKLREDAGIPPTAKVIMFASASINDERKGGDLLLKALKLLNNPTKEKIYLLIIGKGGKNFTDDLKGFETISTGNVQGEKKDGRIL